MAKVRKGLKMFHRRVNCAGCGVTIETLNSNVGYQVCSLACRVAIGVERGAPDECWPWQHTKNAAGYGRLGFARRYYLAHRVAYEMAKGPIPRGMFVMHACDNPACCNPAHLSVGTPADNVADKIQKGRGRGPQGERQRDAKLTEDMVRAIRASREPRTTLASRYGVLPAQISRIRTFKRWKHVA